MGMFSFLKKKEKAGPARGEIWALRDESPWPTKKRIRIIDVKDGWVKYNFIG